MGTRCGIGRPGGLDARTTGRPGSAAASWRGVAVLAALLLPWVVPLPAFAAGRVALVVGNSAYEHIGRLPNPTNDAADVGAALRRLGFEVTVTENTGRTALNDALRAFTRRSTGADVALVFYAGHGMEMDGVNYVLPVDARLERDTDVRFETVTLDDVLVSTEGAGLRLVILDACRNNPLARKMQRTSRTRNVSNGSLGKLNENLLGGETLVAYSAAAGTTADDGEGRNSPYTEALLTYLEQPLEISRLFRRVRGRVLTSTAGRQRPHEYQSLLGDHYLSVPGGLGAPGAKDLYYAEAPPGAAGAASRLPAAGLKYRILRRGSAGQAVEVDQDTVFRTGDRIRLGFEPNIDGFLYVIQQGASGRWSMLFPHPEIADGQNDVARFAEVSIPSAGWFRFDDTPGTERVIVYLSREKVTALPGAGGPVVKVESVAQPTVTDLTRTIRPRDLVFEKDEAASDARGGAVQAVYVVNQDEVGQVVWETIELLHR